VWFRGAWLLLVPCALAQNQPRFAFTLPGQTSGSAAVAVDSHGNSYLTGSVLGNPFTATAGAFQSQNNGGNVCLAGGGLGPPYYVPCPNAFVIKLDPSGVLVFATYLGGSGNPSPTAIAVDSNGNVYVAGSLVYGDFPVTPGAAFSSGTGFIVKLSASGSQLVYATLLPGTTPASIQIDQQGNLLFVGDGNEAFPATPGAYQSTYPVIPGVSSDGRTVAGKLNASGSALVWGTYVSGDLGFSLGSSVATDPDGNVLVGGTDAGIDGSGAEQRAFLSKLSSDGAQLISTTVLATGTVDWVKASATGDIYVLCNLTGTDYPATAPGFGVPVPPPTQGVAPAFLLHMSADGVTVLNNIYLPFTATGLDVDSAGNAYLAGTAYTSGPVMASAGAFQPTYGGGVSDGIIAKITPPAEIAGVTYFGGSDDDNTSAIAVERDGSVVVAGRSSSPGFLGQTTFAGVLFAANFFPAQTIENSASFVANTAAPGEIVAIRGYGLGPTTGVSASGPGLPFELAGVQVSFYCPPSPLSMPPQLCALPAPIFYVQSEQINVQVPWELAGQTSTAVEISYPGFTSTPIPVLVAPSLPGIFYVNNSDGTQNSSSNPAKPGDFITIYGTGGGPTSPTGVDGAFWTLSTPFPLLTLPTIVTLGSANATVLYAGASPLSPSGIFQINALLPPNLPASASALVVNIGGVSSVAVPIAIQ
jgi:uncharacterized protein (TIGR03437 family)